MNAKILGFLLFLVVGSAQALTLSATVVRPSPGPGPGPGPGPQPGTPSLLTGTYWGGPNKDIQLIIDANDRIQSNLAIVNNATGERLPLTFPHRLRQDASGLYRSEGLFQLYLSNGVYMRLCQFAATLEADVFNEGQAIDATLVYPANAGLDGYGRCVWLGYTRTPFSLTKTLP